MCTKMLLNLQQVTLFSFSTQFYGIMTGVYAIYAIIWLIALGCNYTDLVRLQFWVLGVVVLGFLEKTLFLAEYDAVNQGRECKENDKCLVQ